jgi:ubiquitin conjugation factor E4 B
MRVYAPRKRVAVVCRDGVVPTQEDACTIPCELNSMKPDTLRRSKPSPDLLKLCARCLGATDTLVKSPHAREKLGKALYDLFLPVNAKGKTYTELALYRQPLQENPGNVELLANASPEIAAKLCPAILWLFGDAEHIGDIYQIADQRLRIAALIKHLWDAPVHRAAFRTIVADVRAFVTFANGLLNETNKLVAGAIERLPEIRNHQVRTGLLDASNDEFRRLRAEYESANDTRREELDSRHSEHEQHLKQDLELCTEILSLVEMLTGDTAVAKAFMGEELRSRLAGMLLSVVRQFTGKRSLDIKISNPDAYGFDPKDILSRVGRIACCFAGEPEFPGALAESGYYDVELLPRCAQTLRRLGALASNQLDALDSLAKAAGVAREALSLDDGLENEAPEEFVDPLTAELMKSPVKLPSGNVVDDSTIRQHLLNELSDPFSRQPLEPADLEPLPDLKKRIEEWLAVKRAERRAARGG